MTTEQRAELKVKIAKTIELTKDKIIKLERDTQPISPENSIGRISRMDAINNKSVAEAGLRSAKRKLSNLEKAYIKIDDSGFGNCAACKNPIRPARLMYMPESTRCVRCAGRR
ncbi:MAG: TraR/DksA family transcriptional regulator [Saprospiraceae bacterium]